jgi:hypothetical protein
MSSLPDAKALDEPTELLAFTFTRSSRAADVAVHAMPMKQTRRVKQNKNALKRFPRYTNGAKSSSVLPFFTRDKAP